MGNVLIMSVIIMSGESTSTNLHVKENDFFSDSQMFLSQIEE